MVSTEMGTQSPAYLAEHLAVSPYASSASRSGRSTVIAYLKTKASELFARHLEKQPRLQKVLWECGSFQHRIRIALSSSDTYRLPMGSLSLESPVDQCVYTNTRCLARIQHIQTVAANLRWATPLDWKAHLESWEAGVQWASRTLGSGSALSDEHKALLASDLSYKIPQPTS